MKRWTRATFTCRCGRCGALIGVGVPVLQLQLERTRTIKLRCGDCAGEAPPDLPPIGDAPPRPAPIASMRRFGLLPLDEIEREPGQEG